jgi:type I restriction enzyme S subunit
MELMPGHKRSDIGVIPGNWTVESLGDLADFVTSGSRGWAQFYSEYGALFIRSQNVRDGQLRFDDVQYVSPPTGAEGNRTKVELNDLLVTITGNSVGNVALVDQVFDEAYISQHVGLVRLKEPTKGEYICRYLAPNSPGNSQIAGSQSGQSKPGLNLQNLKDFRIALPPSSAELHAITSALRDVDALIDGLDRLIAKKRDLKQAAMQQLLTGETRLPGFHGEWEVKRLGDVAEMGSGGTPPSSVPAYYDGDIPWVSIADMTKAGKVITGTDRNLTRAGFACSTAQMFPAGTVLYAMYASIGECSIAGVSLCSSQAILGIRPSGRVSNEFLYYYFCSLKHNVKSLGQHGTQANLNKGMIQHFRLRLPPLPEQTAIAALLSDMDAELAALEARRAKTRDLKQAMMQELLTGRTRLV